MKGLIYGG